MDSNEKPRKRATERQAEMKWLAENRAYLEETIPREVAHT